MNTLINVIIRRILYRVPLNILLLVLAVILLMVLAVQVDKTSAFNANGNTYGWSETTTKEEIVAEVEHVTDGHSYILDMIREGYPAMMFRTGSTTNGLIKCVVLHVYTKKPEHGNYKAQIYHQTNHYRIRTRQTDGSDTAVGSGHIRVYRSGGQCTNAGDDAGRPSKVTSWEPAVFSNNYSSVYATFDAETQAGTDSQNKLEVLFIQGIDIEVAPAAVTAGFGGLAGTPEAYPDPLTEPDPDPEEPPTGGGTGTIQPPEFGEREVQFLSVVLATTLAFLLISQFRYRGAG